MCCISLQVNSRSIFPKSSKMCSERFLIDILKHFYDIRCQTNFWKIWHKRKTPLLTLPLENFCSTNNCLFYPAMVAWRWSVQQCSNTVDALTFSIKQWLISDPLYWQHKNLLNVSSLFTFIKKREQWLIFSWLKKSCFLRLTLLLNF